MGSRVSALTPKNTFGLRRHGGYVMKSECKEKVEQLAARRLYISFIEGRGENRLQDPKPEHPKPERLQYEEKVD